MLYYRTMNPDRSAEQNRFSRRNFLVLLGVFAGSACVPAAVSRLATATPSPAPEEPKDPTSVPADDPTATPEPATPTPEPTAVPVVEIPYQMYGVYSGSLFADRTPQPKGGLVITPLPAPINKILIHYDVYRTCSSNPQERFPRSFLVDFNTISGPGFSQGDGLGNVITAALIRPGVMGGNIQFRDNVPPGCGGEFLSFSSADLKGTGRSVLGQELVASRKKIGGGENPPENLLRIVEDQIKVTLPTESK